MWETVCVKCEMCVSNWEKNDWEGTHLYDVYVFCILRKIQKAKLLSRITDGQLHELAAFWGHKISKTVTTSKSNFERLPSSQSYLKKKKRPQYRYFSERG